MAHIRLEHVRKQYPNGFTAIHDLSLDIEENEFVVLVGPSGCGKSTLLRMIAGLEKITSGTLSMDGKVMNDVEPKDRNLAMVFQNYALYPHFTVYDNMAFSLKMRRADRNTIREKVEAAAEILGLSDYLKRKPGELSGGQRQRVAMGRAIVREPRAFLMDEPLSNLDAKLRVQMREEIAKLYERLNTTFIYVTHDQIEAMTLGTRVVVLEDGKIHQAAPPQILYEQPSNQFVASFIGSPQMNFIPGKELYDGRIIGIRPEHIQVFTGEQVLSARSDFDIELNGTIRFTEMLGDEDLLHVDLEDQMISVLCPHHDSFKAGTRIHLLAKADRHYHFDAESKEALPPLHTAE